MDTKTAVTALAALSQQSRLTVFRTLVERGPLGATPKELIEMLAIAPATLSFHLKELTYADLVRPEQLGRSIRYRADLDVMRSVVDFLTQNCCSGNPSLCEPLCGPGCAPAAAPKRVTPAPKKKAVATASRTNARAMTRRTSRK